MGHFAEFHISKGTTNAADIFTSLNFYWFYACVCVSVLCRFVCSLSLYICALLSSPSLGKKRFYVQYFIMASEKDTLGVRAASKWQQQCRFVLYLILPVQQIVCVCVCVGGLLCRVGDCNLMPLQAIPSCCPSKFYCRRVSLSIFYAFYANLRALTLSHFNGKQSASEIWRMCRKVKCSAQRFRLPISLGYFGNTLDLSFSQVEAHYAYVRLHTRDKASLVSSLPLSLARSLWHCATLL